MGRADGGGLSVLHFGTSSWSTKGWVGPFYPAGTRPKDFLTLYAEHFDTVEADNTYYAVPALDLVRGWERKLPEGFTLAAKFPRSIVHAGEGPRPSGRKIMVSDQARADTAAFLEAMSLMGAKCGPLVLQFPYLAREVCPSVVDFAERLDTYLGGLPDTFRYAVEVRNADYLREDLTRVLRRHRVALVLTEVARMPHPADVLQRLDAHTADFGYARLIGNRRETDALTKTFDQTLLDKTESLERWADLLRASLGSGRTTFVYANNHYAGHGPATARALRELVT